MEIISRSTLAISLLAGLIASSAPVTAHGQGITDMKKGQGGSAVQGSAGPSGAQNAASDLEQCDKPMGVLAVVKVLAQPSDAANPVTTLAKNDELIFMGKEQDGFVSVETSKGAGWVKKVLVTR